MGTTKLRRRPRRRAFDGRQRASRLVAAGFATLAGASSAARADVMPPIIDDACRPFHGLWKRSEAASIGSGKNWTYLVFGDEFGSLLRYDFDPDRGWDSRTFVLDHAKVNCTAGDGGQVHIVFRGYADNPEFEMNVLSLKGTVIEAEEKSGETPIRTRWQRVAP